MNAAHTKPRRRWLPRAEWLGAVTGVLALALFVVLAVVAVDQARELHSERAARDALARQVESLGATPVAGPPGSRGEPGQSITGPKGDKGDPGPEGPTGPPGPSGSPGEDGDNGSDGTEGTAGEPGTVGATGPAGPAGPQGPQGEPGAPGPQGEPGTAGQDGSDGQTCPDGYSLQAPSYDPDALVCRKDGAPDPGPRNGGGNGPLALDPQRRQYM